MRAGFHAILPCGPVQTSFQVKIEIYEDKLGQSGDRILSSHITYTIIDFTEVDIRIYLPENVIIHRGR